MSMARRGSSIPEPLHTHLRNLHRGLLQLHKTLLDSERKIYEDENGPVSSGQMLQLVINDEHFAWLRAISKLIVRIDETMDSKEPVSQDDLDSLYADIRSLLHPAEYGTDFERKYFAALQRQSIAQEQHEQLHEMLGR